MSLTVLAPLRVEAWALHGRLGDATVVRSGMGRRSGEVAAVLDGRGPVAVAGLCGALDPTLRIGDVVVATEVRAAATATVASPSAGLVAGALRRYGVAARLGPVVTTERVVRGKARRQLAETGAMAADMESAWVAGHVAERPFTALRVVSDSPHQELLRPMALHRITRALRALRKAAPALSGWAGAAATRRVVLAGPRSFCAGVERAIDVVERALERYGPPVYVRKQIVHNRHVVQRLEGLGAVFVDEIDEVPEKSVLVISAHGVAPTVRQRAEALGMMIIDATCPLVAKVHHEARRFAARGFHIVLVGHEGHDEIEGTRDEVAGIDVVGSPDEVASLVDDGRPVA